MSVWVATPVSAQRQMERLGRGLIALRSSSTQVWIGWRFLGQDPVDLAFNLYRVTAGNTNRLNVTPLRQTTDFADTPPTFGVPHLYFIRPVWQGVEVEDRWAHPQGRSAWLLPANPRVPTDFQGRVAPYLEIPLRVPAGGTSPDGVNYTYSPNDCSPGDLDGDGEYEIVLKWDPSNSKDNAQSGYTGNVFLDAYQLDGTHLWRIDLGRNIRAGAHYTQFLVYDLDGDGRAEVVCKTAPGTVDGQGRWVLMPGDNPMADYRNSSGYILSGPEYLTVFDGLTGAALWTTNYLPPRGSVSAWGDSYGNRVDRFLACVAYLDGVRPSVVMCRGYYTRTVLVAWDWREGRLIHRWTFDSNAGWGAYAGQGNHNLSVADVDGDGRDEIIYGACVIDHDGRGLYSTGWGHGDAMHVSDMDPDRPGLEVWQVHESPSAVGGGSLREARTGQLLWGIEGPGDTGRGLAAPIDGRFRGYQFWSSVSPGVLNLAGQSISTSRPSINFAVWWDEDVLRELHDSAGSGGTAAKLDKWTGNGVQRILSPYSVDGGALNINGTKANPCLSGDLLGDWREEMLLRSADDKRLMLFVSVTPATNRFRTFLHDPQYRLALAWQNVAYNQPPHPSFYVGVGMDEPPVYPVSPAELVWTGGGGNVWDFANVAWAINSVWTQRMGAVYRDGRAVLFDLRGASAGRVQLADELRPAAVTVYAPVDYEFWGGSLAGPMGLVKAGTGSLTLNNTNSFTGPTEVSEGTLWVNGAITASPVRVRPGPWLSSRLGGTGLLGAGASVGQACIIDPGAAPGQTGTLTISNELVLQNARLQFDLSAQAPGIEGAHDRIRVAGAVTLVGTNRVTIRLTEGRLAAGSHPLIEFLGPLTGGLAQLELVDPPLAGLTLGLTSGSVVLVVPGPFAEGGRALVWRGSGTVWDTGTSAHWLFEGQPTVFLNGDRVYFDDTGAAAPEVNLLGDVRPALVSVNASANYRFSGAGSIMGTNRLIKAGTGTLTLSTTNRFSGGILLSNGVLALSGSTVGSFTANQFAPGTGPITFYGGTLQLHGYNLGDNTSSYGSFTNTLIVPAGQTGVIRTGPRQTLGSRVLGSGTLELFVDYVRGEVSGDWTAFTGVLRVRATPGTPAVSSVDDFRVNHAAGFPSAKVQLGAQVAMYSRAGAGSVIPIGELSAEEGAFLLAGGGSGLGAQHPVTWRVGALNTSATNAALIRGSTSLTKEGTGTWTLTASNDYSGSTVVSEGRLVILGNQRAATGMVAVAVGASLGGWGVIGGLTRISGTLAPGGVRPVTLTFARDLILEPTATTALKLAVPDHDRLVVEGTCVLGGRLHLISTLPEPLLAGHSFRLIQAARLQGNFREFQLPVVDEGLSWRTDRLAVDGTLWVVRTTPPQFTVIRIEEDQIKLRAENGTPNWPVRLRRTADLTLPVSAWEIVAENVFDSRGHAEFTVPMNVASVAAFYRIEVP
ncbi:MAG: autotransporter-associated beta strand repeat-containing protein [Verrucomicrobiota bacterium]|nr:autotransporter-associated beta strand repeat-containing protein [Verrucomicrobiota bacterium]